jgi:hypothetical protein
MTNGDYGACADQLEDFMRDLEPWRDELMAMSSTPLPDLFHKLAGEHDGAVALLLEELRERDGPRYRLTRHTAPASLSEAASNPSGAAGRRSARALHLPAGRGSRHGKAARHAV